MRHIIAGGQHCGQHNMELCGLSVSGAASGDILKQLPAGGWTTLRELELGKLSYMIANTRIKPPRCSLSVRTLRLIRTGLRLLVCDGFADCGA